MREILFRGKRLDNGELVEGYLYYQEPSLTKKGNIPQHPGAWYILQTAMVNIHAERPALYIEIDPATIGQYTGLKDKNGKRIFEGDMLKPFDDEIDKMVVEFHHGGFVLCLYGDRGYRSVSGDWEFDGSNYGVIECELLSSYGDDIEIIGNTHDNPELLGG